MEGCFFFKTDFSLIILWLEFMAAESFCRVGVIGTDGEDMGTADEGEDNGCLDEGVGGKILQNFPE